MIDFTPTEVIPDYGDLMTVKEFHNCVRSGLFIDYDGYGHPVKKGLMSRQAILPSKTNQIPETATHIIWFNR